MRVSVFGLGYVGAVTAGCLAELGHDVIGVDVHQQKVDTFDAGLSPIAEPGLARMLADAKGAGRLRATSDAASALEGSEISIVCVGTPCLSSGHVDLQYVEHVTHQIATTLRASGKPHSVVFRSTLVPGSTRRLVADWLSDLHAASQVQVYYSPDFLREGSAISDFQSPSLAVVGTHDGSAPGREIAEHFAGGNAVVVSWESAEAIKHACNYFHALKVGFANEIGRICKFLGEDGTRVMDAVCGDTTLNISASYLRPGNPFGGSCLTKDIDALDAFAREAGVGAPLLGQLRSSNEAHHALLLTLVEATGHRRIGLLGLAFKPTTDDLRGSAMVALAETLLARGHELRIYDPQVDLARLIGANATEIHRRMPHLAALLCSSAANVVEQSDLIVAAHQCAPIESFAPAVRPDQSVIDVNGWPELASLPWRYQGLCW